MLGRLKTRTPSTVLCRASCGAGLQRVPGNRLVHRAGPVLALSTRNPEIYSVTGGTRHTNCCVLPGDGVGVLKHGQA